MLLGKNRFSRFGAMIGASLAFAVSCGTAKVLEEGQYILGGNEVKIVGEKSISSSEINAYIKQQPPVWWNFNSDRVIYNPDLVESSVESISKHLQYVGYFDSHVESEVRLKDRKATVIYTVHPGRRFIIDSISFVTPASSPEFSKAFMEDIENVSVKPGSFLSESSLEDESARSAAALKGQGFYNISRNHYEFVADTIGLDGHALLEMRVNDFTRAESEELAQPLRAFKVGQVTISHPSNLKFRDEILGDITTIKPGSRYNDTDITNTFSRISALGTFSSVSINMVQSDSTTVDCAIRVTPSKTEGFKAGLELSSNSTGLMGISPQLSFYNKNLFHGGEWLNVNLMGNFQFRLGSGTHANEFGVTTSLSVPKIPGLSYQKFKGPNIPRTEMKMSLNYQDRPEYTRSVFSTSLGLSWRTPGRVRVQMFLPQISFVRLYNIDPVFNTQLSLNPYMQSSYLDHIDSGVGGSLYYISDESVNPKSSFFYVRSEMDLSGNLLSTFNNFLKQNEAGAYNVFGSPYSQYARLNVELGNTLKFGRNGNQALATRFVAGLGQAYGNSSALPFEKKFYAGGANSMRGWAARTLGPGSSPLNEVFSIPSQSGDLKFELDMEYRFPIKGIFEGAWFWEAGNVWDSFKGMGKSIAMDTGLGLRLNLQAIVVRLDGGIKLRDPKRLGAEWLTPSQWLLSDGYAIHFGVGYPF